MATSASLDWISVVSDLILEGAPPARIAAWLDGTASTHDGYVVVRKMRAIEGFDATLLVRDGRPTMLSIWYRDLEKPTLADAEAILGTPTEYPQRAFDLVFREATRPIDERESLVVSCSASGRGLESTQRFLVGIALAVGPVGVPEHRNLR